MDDESWSALIQLRLKSLSWQTFQLDTRVCAVQGS